MEGANLNWIDVSGENSERYKKNLKAEMESRFHEGTFKQWVDEKLPGWIVSEHASYTSDLQRLSLNWGSLCERLQVPRRGILRVKVLGIPDTTDPIRDAALDEDKKKKCNTVMLNTVCELLTKSGYIVKGYKEFVPCKACGDIMLGKLVQQTLWGPGNFSTVCNDCLKKQKEGKVTEVPS